MPVLGSSDPVVVKRGVSIPRGSLDVFKAALASARNGAGLAEIVAFGDSTTYGSSTPGYFSWLHRLHSRVVAAGIADGGCGYVNPGDWLLSTGMTHDGVYPTVSNTGFSAAANITGAWLSNSGNGTDSVSIAAPATRIRLYLGSTPTSGKVAYSVDGGAETTVDLLHRVTESTMTGYSPYDVRTPVNITGLSDTAHTLTVRSAGQASIRPPTYSATYTGAGRVLNPQLTSGGALTQGQAYEFEVTAVSASGESLPVQIPSTYTPGAVNKTFACQGMNDYGYTHWKIYRRNAGSGAYGLVNTVAAGTVGSLTSITDGGNTEPTSEPPTSNTLGTYASGVDVNFFADFVKASGVTIHRNAYSGASAINFYDSVTLSAQTRASTGPFLGLPTEENATTNANSTQWGVNVGTKPTWRNPCLLIVQLGHNDLSGSSNPIDDGKLRLYLANTHGIIRMARAAGADVVLVAPPMDTMATPGATQATGEGRMAFRALADATGCAWLDFAEALGPVNTWTASGYAPTAFAYPHLNQAAYTAEADYFFEQVVAPLL